MRQFVFIALAVLFGITPELAAEHRTTVEQLAQKANKTRSIEHSLHVLREVKDLDDGQLHHFLQRTSRGALDARVIAALALKHVNDQRFLERYFALFASDDSTQVRLAAWLSLDRKQFTDERKRWALGASNQLIRAVAVLRNEDESLLSEFCYDVSPFVRTIAIRRLARLGNEDSDELRAALAVCLIDHHQLVRSNALLLTRRFVNLPTPAIGLGLLTDDREIVPLEDVFTGENESGQLRLSLALPEAMNLNLALLKIEIIKSVEPIIPKPEYPALVVPLDQDVLIGSVAANLGIHVHRVEVLPILRLAIRRREHSSSPLSMQLRSIGSGANGVVPPGKTIREGREDDEPSARE